MSRIIKSDSKAVYDHIINFRQPFSIPFNAVLSQTFANPSQPATNVNLTLTAFRFGTLKSITIAAIRNSNLTGVWNVAPVNNATLQAQNAKNRIDFMDLRDIVLTYNGQIIYLAPGDSDKIYQTQLDVDSSQYSPTRWFDSGSNSQVSTLGVLGGDHIYEIPISQYSANWNQGHLMSGIEIGQNVVNIQFTCMQGSTTTVGSALDYPLQAGEPCTFYAIYNYNSGIKVEHLGAQSDLVF
jgi:hypothetical protein